MRFFAGVLLFVLVSPLWAEDQQAPTGWQSADPWAPPAPSAPQVIEPSANASDQALITQAPPVAEPPPNWAVAAMLAIDPKYANGIVLVVGKGGTPEPRQWVVVARDSDNQGVLHKLTVQDGTVISDALSLNTYEALRQNVSIDPTQVQVDSGEAFLAAQPYGPANGGKIIGHVDYTLTIRGKDATPLWTLNCFDLNGGFLGKVILLATTGQIIQTPGFKNAPTP